MNYNRKFFLNVSEFLELRKSSKKINNFSDEGGEERDI